MTLLLLFGGTGPAAPEAAAEFAWLVRAGVTDTLLHAEATVGERNVIYILATLTDQTGEVLVDETGQVLVAFGATPVLVLHTTPTDTLLHAEA